MAIIINNPSQVPIVDNRDTGIEILLALIMLVIVAFLIIYYAIPLVGNSVVRYKVPSQVSISEKP